VQRVIRPLVPVDAEACDAIIAGLPDWFGDPWGIEECARAVRSQDGLVALDDAGEIVGFCTWVTSDAATAEITWMAVWADGRRRGVGTALLDALVRELIRTGVRSLLVKTLSARDPYPPYAQTRAFYLANGFAEVEELDIWGPDNPAVLLRRDL
jgi:GNAT superfamily N-acetyltransferase